MEAAATGQLTERAADVYEAFFVPALFGEWAPRLADAAQLASGQQVLDVACGTGVLAREAAQRVGAGNVVGLDCNAGMLQVARQRAGAIDWRCGRAESLEFDDASFDAVLCQFGLMFFTDGAAALREMWRVLRPGGRLVVAVWDAVDTSPGYAAMVGLLHRLFGEHVAAALLAPFCLGDTAVLTPLFEQAGVGDLRVQTITGRAQFDSLSAWVHTDVKGWTLADMIDDAQFAVLQREAETALAEFVQPDGTVAFTAPAHIVAASKA